MKILIGCEYTGTLRRAFRKNGIDAWSCDIRDSLDNSKFHIKNDVKKVLENESWHGLFIFPPCTYLTITGNRWFNVEKYGEKAKQRHKLREDALEFIRYLFDYKVNYLCLENPIGVISTRIKKPTQIIQPWQFGHAVSKSTCLWLQNLPKLVPTSNLKKNVTWDIHPSGKRIDAWYSNNKKDRDKTFDGIARAMVEQWTPYLRGEKHVE
jgi:hypothetical protein